MCKVEDCEIDQRIVSGYCMPHYRRWKATGNPLKSLWDIRKETLPKVCAVDDCELGIFVRPYCTNHYRRFRNYGDPLATDFTTRSDGSRKCDVDGCEKRHNAKGYCAAHYAKLKKYGDPSISKYADRTVLSDGYVIKNGKAEHRWVMEEMLGRLLVPGENVHHKNGDRQDNRPENLELWSRSQPAGQRVEDKVNWALEMIALYAPEKLRNQ